MLKTVFQSIVSGRSSGQQCPQGKLPHLTWGRRRTESPALSFTFTMGTLNKWAEVVLTALGSLKNLMTTENWYNITNSWIASFPGKIMYRKGQKKRNMSAFYLLTFYGPLWWKCPLLPDFGSTLFFKLVECWSNSRVHPFSCALRHKVLREVKLQGLSHKN